MNDAKEEIRARLAIEDVVGQYVELKRAGRNLKGHSPWGVDKTPSFMVSPEKGIWHDFSANKGGDIFSFVMEVEGISFREALEKLAAQAGVELGKYSGSDAEVAKRKVRAREALELACKYYQYCLSKNKKIAEYVFYQRNLNRKTVKEFRIGYAPKDGKALIQFLKQRGYSLQVIQAAGLTNRFDGDIFRGRITIPFIDSGAGNTGQVIGFTARVTGHDEPKYLNTPETILFNKSRFIFGLHHAKPAIRASNYVIIVEGNMDVISSHQAGVCEAVATSGTAMTEQHLKILSRLTKDIRLAYDSDEAGIRATERAIMLAGDLGITLSVISDYHGAKDPDELIQRDPTLWQQAVQNKRPAVEWLLEQYETKLNLTTGDGKREYSDVAVKLINYLHDPVERKHYEQLVARRLNVSVDDLLAKKVTGQPRHKKFLKKPVTPAPVNNQLRALEDNLLALAVYGGLNLADLNLPTDETRLAELELIFDSRYNGWTTSALQKEAQILTARYHTTKTKQQIAALTAQLTQAANDEEATKNLLLQITTLQKDLKK